MDPLSPSARLYAAAILAVGTPNPTPSELQIVSALGILDIDFQHKAVASHVRRTAAGEPEAVTVPYREPAEVLGEA